MAYFRQALLLHDQLRDDDVAMRIDLLTKLGTAERQAGDPEHRDTLLKACRLARRIDDRVRLAEAALANNSGTFSTFQGVDTERVEMLETAIAAGGANGRQALLIGTLANELTYAGDYDRRRQLVDDALREARASGDDALLLLRVINLVFYPLWIPETLDERLALTEESLALVAAVRRSPSPVLGRHLQLPQRGAGGPRRPGARRTCTPCGSCPTSSPNPRCSGALATPRAAQRLLAGDPSGAEPFAHEALDLGNQAGEAEAARVLQVPGDVHPLAARHAAASSAPPSRARPRVRRTSVASLCVIFCEAGRDDEAAVLLDRATDMALHRPRPRPGLHHLRGALRRDCDPPAPRRERRPCSTTCIAPVRGADRASTASRRSAASSTTSGASPRCWAATTTPSTHLQRSCDAPRGHPGAVLRSPQPPASSPSPAARDADGDASRGPRGPEPRRRPWRERGRYRAGPSASARAARQHERGLTMERISRRPGDLRQQVRGRGHRLGLRRLDRRVAARPRRPRRVPARARRGDAPGRVPRWALSAADDFQVHTPGARHRQAPRALRAAHRRRHQRVQGLRPGGHVARERQRRHRARRGRSSPTSAGRWHCAPTSTRSPSGCAAPRRCSARPRTRRTASPWRRRRCSSARPPRWVTRSGSRRSTSRSKRA